jgi:hypothetical protein
VAASRGDGRVARARGRAFLFGRGHQHEAAVGLLQLGGGGGGGLAGHALFGIGEEDLEALLSGVTAGFAAHQHAGVAFAQQQDGGQQQGVDICDALGQQPGVVARLAQQAQGLVGHQAALQGLPCPQ